MDLTKELDYIRNYVDLQRLRMPSEARVHLDVTGVAGGKRVAPYTLVPFIENAFGLGVNQGRKSGISISVEIQENKLRMIVLTDTGQNGSDSITADPNIIKARQRLEYLYPGMHNIHCEKREDTYCVSLEITLS